MIGSAVSVAREIELALDHVSTREEFVNEVLAETLEWPIPIGTSFEDMAYEWSSSDLRAAGLEASLVAGAAHQLVLPGNPWGIFLLEFQREDALISGRGMTGLLRRILQGLVERKRAHDPHLAAFRRENLLFICTFGYQRFRFVYFKAPIEGLRSSPLASFGWGRDDLGALRTICEYNLASLRWPDPMPPSVDQWVTAWSSAFDVERVTKRFYDDYAVVFSRAEAAIKPLTTMDDADLRLFTQSLFNRLMFLRFLERKGWLTFPQQRQTRYLEALAADSDSSGESIYRSRVTPLFFEGLSHGRKGTSEKYGQVPRLNGGLFEKTGLDEMAPDIPDSVLRSIVGTDGLFYRYNFTVEESTPLNVDVAVDPEMLGRVFEELVTGRHGSGSYYTPRPIVSYMCREVLKHYIRVGAEASPEAIARLVSVGDTTELSQAEVNRIESRLEEIKVLDPACGSGAYLLGFLHELIELRRILRPELQAADSRRSFELKLHIISRSLYGVDIDPFATEIAKLRLWLSLAIESDDPIPLPNLDYKIETGDSLGPFDRVGGLFDAGLRDRAEKLQTLKEDFLTAHGKNKETLRSAISTQQTGVSTELRHIVRPGVVDWHVQFADVLSRRGGFDVVLANPPYVSAIEHGKQVGTAERKAIRNRFQSTTGAWDLFIPFFERGVELMREDGFLAYISPNKYLSASYATALRSYLRANTTVLQVVDLSQVPVFRSASVYPVLTFLCRGRDDSRQVISRLPETLGSSRATNPDTFRTVQLAQSTLDLLPDHLWGFLLSDRLPLLTRLLPETSTMPHFAEAGATTTAAEAETYGERLEEATDETAFKVVNTGTIDPFLPQWGRERMTDSGSRYLRPILRKEFISTRRRDMYGSPKVMIAKIAGRCEAFLDPDGKFAGLNVNCLITPTKGTSLGFLCAYLNSKVFMFFYDQLFGALRMSGGYYQFQAPQLRLMPVPKATTEEQRLIAKLGDQAAELATGNDARRLDEILLLIDVEIGGLVGLSRDEVQEL